MSTHKTPPPYLNVQFLQHLSVVAFSGYLHVGCGCVAISELENINSAKAIENLLEYIPYQSDSENILVPPNAVDMIQNYDPQKEFILVVKEKSEKMLSIQLRAQRLGSTPKEAYRSWSRQNGLGALIPGELVCLKETAQDISPGHYIFLNRDRAFMKLCRVGLDDDEGEITTTNEFVKCHCDYEECFKVVDAGLIT